MANHGKEEGTKLIANNKKAYHDYFVDETFECGIELAGTEVKSLRLGQCSIKESFCNIKNGEVFIYGMHVNPYEKGNIFNKDPLRDRKLLLHKSEINKILGKLHGPPPAIDSIALNQERRLTPRRSRPFRIFFTTPPISSSVRV